MKQYDVIVVGAGDVGLGIAFKAAGQDLKVALIDKGNFGGTCVNVGCVPSKTLIYTADRIVEANNNSRLNVSSPVVSADFQAVMARMREAVTTGRDGIREAVTSTENIDFIGRETHFLDEHTLAVGDEKVSGKKIFIATGARPFLPAIAGLDKIPYLTNESVLTLKEKPASIAFLGGGYIALEYAHFFSAFGVEVHIVSDSSSFLPFGEPEISELLKKEMEKRARLHMGMEAVSVKKSDRVCQMLCRDVTTGREEEISADAIMVAAGRQSNADILKPENAGVELNERNFINVDDYLRTNKKHIWAAGDAIGRAMFTHTGDKEAEIAWHNASQRKKIPMNFQIIPYAVYTYPQVASVGMTEEQARKNHEILVGSARYSDTVMGTAMAEFDGLAKTVVEKNTGRILGFHIIGPQAAILIQEVVNAMLNGGNVKSITGCMHIFPALSGIIPETLGNLR